MKCRVEKRPVLVVEFDSEEERNDLIRGLGNLIDKSSLLPNTVDNFRNLIDRIKECGK